MKKLLIPAVLTVAICCIFQRVDGQSVSEPELPEPQNPEMLNSEQELADYLDQSDYLLNHPVNLAVATRQDLLGIPGMSEQDADAILALRNHSGLNQLSDLDSISFLSPQFTRYLKNRTRFESPRESGNSGKLQIRNRVKIPDAASPESWNSLQRIRWFSPSGIQAGFQIEKDPAETNLADFKSGFISAVWSPPEWGQVTAIAGSYKFSTGHGLLFGGSGLSGKSSGTVYSPVKNTTGISPNLSTEENLFLSGAALSYSGSDGFFSGGILASNRKLDGKRIPVTFFSEEGVPAGYEQFRFDFSGIHSDSAGRAKMDRLPVRHYLIWVNFFPEEKVELRLAGGREYFGLSPAVITDDSGGSETPDRYQLPQKQESVNRLASVGITLKNWDHIFSGEFARTNEKSAGSAYLMAEPFSGLRTVIQYRKLDPGFGTLFSRPFSDQAGPGGNEEGWYQAAEFRKDQFRISAYLDRFRELWPGYQNLYPQKGKEFFCGMQFSTGQNQTWLIHYRVRETGISGDSVSSSFREAGKIEWSQVFAGFLVKQRLDYVISDEKKEGVAFSFQAGKGDNEMNWKLQVTWYDAPVFSGRIYVFEPDLPGSMSFNPLYGEGFRLSGSAGYEFLNRIKISGKSAFQRQSRNGQIDNLWTIGFQLDSSF
ncbi:MAG: hypothetical protein L6Q77_03885 [Bacteroidetes bacterium]|nr:hypothetical protein [Bacteroidota bacterium]